VFEDTGAGRSCQTDWACFSPEWCLERLERAHERGAFCGGKGPLDSFLEQAQAGMSPRQAAADAVRHAGPAIGSAGLILAGTFASLILAGNSILQQVGFAVAAGIALAAFVMAMFFSPSLTALVGHRAWWPGHQGDRR